MSGNIWTAESSRAMHERRRLFLNFRNANDPLRGQPVPKSQRLRRERVKEKALQRAAIALSDTGSTQNSRSAFSVTAGDPATFDLLRICDPENLAMIFRSLRATGGHTPGVDGMTYDLSPSQMFRLLRNLSRAIRLREYRPAPTRMVQIPKHSGGDRTLEIPTVLDRVVGAALAAALRPVTEERLPRYFGEKADIHWILARIKVLAEEQAWYFLAVDDIQNFYPTIPRPLGLNCFFEEAQHWGVSQATLADQGIPWLAEKLIYGSEGPTKTTGLAQGSTFSPLLAAVVLLNVLDMPLDRQIENAMVLHRYADNIHVQGPHRLEVQAVMEDIQARLTPNGMRLKEGATVCKDIRQPESLNVLGIETRWVKEQLLFQIPQRAWKRLKENLCESPGAKAGDRIQGFLSAYGPTFQEKAGKTVGRIQSTMRKAGVYTIPQQSIEQWIQEARQKWDRKLTRARNPHATQPTELQTSLPDQYRKAGTIREHEERGEEGLCPWDLLL